MVLPEQTTICPLLVQALAELGGRARPSEVYPLITRHFPALTPEDLTAVLKDGRTNRWRNRIQWARQDLVLAGLIDSSERGVWLLTATGQALAARGAPAREVTALVSAADASARRTTRATIAAPPTLEPPDEPVVLEPVVTLVPPPVMVLRTRPQALRVELLAAAVDSKDPNRLERVVADAFRFLGFDAEWIGGAGKTDVLLRAPLGIRRYSAVVDAKSTARAKVADGQVDWLSIRAHREQERAQYACLVGVDFAGGQLVARALEFQVALLAVEDLAELIDLHSETPLTLTEVRALFVSVPSSRDALPQLRAAARERRRKRLLIDRLLAHIENFNQAQPDIVLAKPETLLASTLAERNLDLLGTTLEDVRRTLLLLETTGVISAVNGEGYVSETTTAGARQLLAAFAVSPDTDQPGARDAGRVQRGGS